ncbi:MAG: tRNA lysidine(34) synthetase TilS [Sphingobacteriales bacterium]|nr:tRNA lysidine(34) synthetase TilS [Sphingobacteriales bacterium]
MNINSVAEFLKKLKIEQAISGKIKLLVAVSGGVDSVVLLHILSGLNDICTLGVAHCNFGLRGQNSDFDELFVLELAQALNLPFYTTHFETLDYAKANTLSIQMAARQLRYDWFAQLQQTHNYHFIATAHHQNDVAETVLLNLTKGAGIAGLHGILPQQGIIIRPILGFNKQQITQYAQQNNLNWQHDASNDQAHKYERNFIRHQVLPTLVQLNPQAIKHIYQTSLYLRDTELVYRQALTTIKRKLLQTNFHGDIEIGIRKLTAIPGAPTILFEVLSDFGFNTTQSNEVWAALNGESGKTWLSPTYKIIKNRTQLLITKAENQTTSQHNIDALPSKLITSGFTLQLNTELASDITIAPTPNRAWFDANLVALPLVLRRWQPGDYFYPFGLNRKKKKLSRFFIDLKLSLADKDRQWVLCDARNRIIWAVGLRADERFRITPKTQQVIVAVVNNQS